MLMYSERRPALNNPLVFCEQSKFVQTSSCLLACAYFFLNPGGLQVRHMLQKVDTCSVEINMLYKVVKSGKTLQV